MPRPILVMLSGGIASAVAAIRACERYGKDAVTLLFCDTKQEDHDLYRFLADVVAYLDIPLVTLCDGRTPWQVFRDVRYLGNTKADPCSRILKRELAHAYVGEHATPETQIVLGLDSCERRRIPKVRAAWSPYPVLLPLQWPPYLDKDACRQVIRRLGLRESRMYGLGFLHDNCGGRCVKGGQANFLHLLRVLPERYAECEAEEEGIRSVLQKPVSILRDRRGGKTRPLTLRQLREQGSTEQAEIWTGCDCFSDED